MTTSELVAGQSPRVLEGPALLAGIAAGPGLPAHRQQYGHLPELSTRDLIDQAGRVRLRGRGGAGFPLAVKLETAAAARCRPVLVVNLAEGEPASAKDTALATTRPHLILDGVSVAGAALGACEVHLVLPGDRPLVEAAMRAAVLARPDTRRRTTLHVADSRFVAGQSSAVLELMAGRPNLPVTSWTPAARIGHRGRPTVVANAETWAQLGLLALVGPRQYSTYGTPEERGTTLLTIVHTGTTPLVVEVPYGAALRHLLGASAHDRPVLLGGFHGTWVTAEALRGLTVSVDRGHRDGLPLGAGVVLVPAVGECPVTLTATITDYLAGQSAGRCGPCRNGLPALAAALRSALDGNDGVPRVEELAGLVAGRGACAHPDGTSRLVRSLLAAFPDEVATHARGGCRAARRRVA